MHIYIYILYTYIYIFSIFVHLVYIYTFSDLSKQFWYPLIGTKNSVFQLSFQIQSLQNFSLKHFGIKVPFKIHWLTSFLRLEAAYKPSRYKKGQKLSEALPREPPSKFHYESDAELTAPWDAHLHFATFKNQILVQKWTLVKTAWINP